MLFWNYVFLAIVQGIAEFLPVSSSGHLALLSYYLGFNSDCGALLSILLHFGSLLAILIFYFREIVGLFARRQWKVFGKLILATIPVGCAGLLFEHFKVNEFLADFPAAIGMAFLVTGMLLKLTSHPKLAEFKQPADLEHMSIRQALTIGGVQVLALLPGISRSGSTISAGVLCGVDRISASTFSFLLAIPAIAGAMLIKTIQICRNGLPEDLAWPALPVSVLLSAAVSFLALAFLIRVVKKSRLAMFSWYMFAAGAAVICLSVIKAIK